ADQVVEVLVSSCDVLTSLHQRREIDVLVLVANERVRLEHHPESLAWITSLLPERRELGEMAGNVPFMPGDQDRFDVWKVLVQGPASDAGLLSDLPHRHRSQSVLGDERPGGVQDRVAHLTPVGLNRLVPEFRHVLSIRNDASNTQWIDRDTMYR